MSISIEDLVSSLSSNHIGQEAIDLAALQAQLAQTIFYQPFPSREPGHPQPQPLCNTPVVRTPSSSISSASWHPEDALMRRRRSSSIASISSHKSRGEKERSMTGQGDILEEDMMVEDDDERMVEDLLHTQPPSSSASSAPTLSHLTSHYSQPPTTSFAFTDPFYTAVQTQAATPSFFAQAGRPAQHSSFFQQQAPPTPRPMPMPLKIDTRTPYAASG